MKLVVQVKLLPTPEQALALEATLAACNTVATSISVTAHEKQVFSAFSLHHLTYHQTAGSGVSAQPRVRAIKKVADAYKTLRANLQAGSYGRVGSPRRAKVEGKPVVFRPDAAQPFDDRCLSWQHQAKTVSIWTTTGRMRGLTYTGLPAHLELLATNRQGESDLIRRGAQLVPDRHRRPARCCAGRPGGRVRRGGPGYREHRRHPQPDHR